MTLRLRVVLFMLGILLPAIAAGAWMVASTYTRERAGFDSTVRETVRALSLVVDRELERRATIVRVLAASSSLQEWDLAAFDRQARAALEGVQGTVALLDRSRQYVNTIMPLEEVARRPPQEPQVFSESGLQLSDLLRGQVTSQQMILFYTPVQIRGKTFNVALSVMPVELLRIIDDQNLPAHWTAAIISGEGRVVARQPNHARWVGSLATADMRRELASRDQGFLQSISLDGQRNAVFFSKSPRFDAAFVIGVPSNDLRGNTYRSVLEVALGACALLLVGVLVSIWVSRRMVRPIELLQAAAQDLESGRVVDLPTMGVQEYDQVGRALVQASERIRAASLAMEQRVTEAVAAVEATQAQLVQSQKLEAIGRLTGGIAHDFNNLLQTLSTGLHVLDKLVQEPRARPLIDAGMRAVNRAARLVQQLLSFVRRAPLKRQTLDFANQLLSMETLLSRALPVNVSLHTDLASDLWKIETDPSQLEVALLNLIFNARDAMPRGGTITIRARNSPEVAGVADSALDAVAIEVSDDGNGMPADILAQVFEPFFTTKPVGQGTGLGLSQVQAFAHDSDGSVSLTSSEGRGTTVTLRLPRSRLIETLEGAPAEPPRLPGPCRLLFVEDDVMIAEVVTSALRGAGFSVILARTGDEALSILQSGTAIDAVFSDVVMPGTINGIELAEKLVREGKGIPVVLASGYSEKAPTVPDIVLLPKPYSIASVVRALIDALAARQA
ncbi:MAG: ATP-binding protein [Pseudomonadota bacterium]